MEYRNVGTPVPARGAHSHDHEPRKRLLPVGSTTDILLELSNPGR